MVKVQVITGYVNIPGHPRSMKEYKDYGARLVSYLGDMGYEVPTYVTDVEGCWLDAYRRVQGRPLLIATGDNPQKNTAAYHAVQHQKFDFLCAAHDTYLDADVFVWIDYGIFHIHDIASMTWMIPDMLEKVRNTGKVEAPGCWAPDCPITDEFPCWRFCGGLWVVPRQLAHPLFDAVAFEAASYMIKERMITWEVNTVARVERKFPKMFRWYKADHDHTMFKGYDDGAR